MMTHTLILVIIASRMTRVPPLLIVHLTVNKNMIVTIISPTIIFVAMASFKASALLAVHPCLQRRNMKKVFTVVAIASRILRDLLILATQPTARTRIWTISLPNQKPMMWWKPMKSLNYSFHFSMTTSH